MSLDGWYFSKSHIFLVNWSNPKTFGLVIDCDFPSSLCCICVRLDERMQTCMAVLYSWRLWYFVNSLRMFFCRSEAWRVQWEDPPNNVSFLKQRRISFLLYLSLTALFFLFYYVVTRRYYHRRLVWCRYLVLMFVRMKTAHLEWGRTTVKGLQWISVANCSLLRNNWSFTQ